MIETMTRTEYRDYLDRRYQETVKNGGNRAIMWHRDKVAAMTDEEFEAHRQKQMSEASAREAAARTMARQAVRKSRKAR